jgi:hypothetical protein
MSQLPSPQYIKSITVINCSQFKYHLYLQLEKDSSQKFIIICPFSKKTYEYDETINGVTFVNPILLVNITSNTGCGEQIEKYFLSSSDVSSVVELTVTIDKFGRIYPSIK